MSVAHTSVYAFNRIKDKLGNKQERVFDALIELGTASNEKLADYLGWPINSVTGRVTELKKMGYLDVHGITKNKSGFTAKVWSVRHPNDSKLKLIEQECED